tara:strand:+ start:53 stop:355 length:303 start_codon:yes stop_codon:yes gene_type:complete
MKGSPAKMGTIKGTSGHASALKKEEEEKKFSTKKDDPNRVNVSDKYKVDDLISEDDLESSFSQKGDDPKNYPQLSVQNYSKVREDKKGKYVVNIGDEIED